MSAETVDDQERGPWRLDRHAMIRRAAPNLYAERQAALRARLRAVRSGNVPQPVPDAGDGWEWTHEEMLAGRRAVDAYREGRGPAPSRAHRAAYRALRRRAKGGSRREPQSSREIVEAAARGMTLAEIAAARGIKEASVLRRLTKDGLLDVAARLRGTPGRGK